MRSYFSFESKGDPLFFLTHRYYLSKTLTVAQRIDCAVAHYSFEGQNYGSIYHRSVYQSPRGLALWHRVLDGTRYELTLCATEDYRYEGDLSVLCFVNGTRVCRISFSYVNGRLFGQPPGYTMFVTRSQTDVNPELQRFRDGFKQNSPPYFCLAAVFGIAMANGMRSIFLVKDEAQIAYQERYAAGFQNSYSALWKAFGAEEMAGRSAYRMSVPPRLSSLPFVKHRNRALARRRNWLEIALGARQAMLEDRLSTVPAPLDGIALEHCLGLGSPSSERRLQPRPEAGVFAFDPPAPSAARKSRAVFVSYEDAEAAGDAVPVAPTQLVAASHGSARRSQALSGVVGALLLVLALAAAPLLALWQRHEHARTVLLPALVDAVARSPHSNANLLDMALEVEKAMPGDRSLARLWPKVATTLSIETQPANVGVYWKDYDTPDAPWRFAGTTPLKDARVPQDLLRLELRKEGFQTVELVSPGDPVHGGTNLLRVKLDRSGSLPPRMVRIPESMSQMGLLGLDGYAGTEVPEFLADKYEVTNREYQAFIDAGGYANPAYWRFKVIDGGREIPLTAALARFTDQSGRPGPSTWKAGTYPDGLADHPVAGVSWYEAAAYAAWAGKQLPTAYHWTRLADTGRAKLLASFSNFNGRATTAAGSLSGLSSYGVYDVAGNVREWVMNAARNPGERYILGGGYSDPVYAFNDAYAQSALDRAPINGFRLIRELPGASAPALAQPLVRIAKVVDSDDPKL
jgi:uncharacterized protein VirK/YbjX